MLFRTTLSFMELYGSRKTTFLHRSVCHTQATNSRGYVMNLDPAVMTLPFSANIDIRDIVRYKEVMKQYNLGPNGGILTSLNFNATKFYEGWRMCVVTTLGRGGSDLTATNIGKGLGLWEIQVWKYVDDFG